MHLFFTYLVLISVFRSGKVAGVVKNKCGMLFDQTFVSGPLQFEIEVFYNQLKKRDDILYLCHNRKNVFYEMLVRDGKNTLYHRPGVKGVAGKITVLKQLVLFYVRALTSRMDERLVFELFKIKYKEIFYTSLFGGLRPKAFLKIRADMDPCHPIATWAVHRHGGLNIGYMHGSYLPYEAVFALIDFDVYGLLGTGFQTDVYRGCWPTGMKYLLLGPISNEAPGMPCKQKKFQAAVFTTSTSDDLWMQDSFLYEFIDACFYSLQDQKQTVFMRTKGVYPEHVRVIEEASMKYGLPWTAELQEGVECSVSNTPIDVVLDVCEIAIIMDISSCAWNALAMKKKFVVYAHPASEHVFEKEVPFVVVRNKNELRQRINALSEMTDEDFAKLILPLIGKCGIYDTGSRIADFVQRSLKEDWT